MPESVQAAVAGRTEKLSRMSVKQLRAEYLSVFGSEPPTHHRQNFYRRIAWEIQAQAEGRRLSEEARQYALKPAADTELNRRIADALKTRRAGEPQDGAQAGPSDATPAEAPAEPPATKPAVPGRNPRLPNAGSYLICSVAQTVPGTRLCRLGERCLSVGKSAADCTGQDPGRNPEDDAGEAA